ncbi:ABC transporter substrate-binding protein [Micromonospora sp. STR1_7]|uniref:ABC transporter substrate-binding protein n=1 Tax=Micromonospora parastrephiae TaxID=2806101 RepID=A0ABS1XYT0_9ACTN|nr:ABC transporter substrate-binding protein [Micromonospora parastrephiae]MBM0234423.1 ABC transporter substrate-binding protein [Micromonospora parastrephiae]
MRVSKRATSAIALSAAAALVASGCSSGGGDGDAAGSKDGSIVIHGVQPENPLVPSNTTETGGGKVVDWLWTGLVEYPNDGGAPRNALAESIDTKDSKVFTIKIKKGTKFHDGTEVKSKNFVDAWNWAAYSPNGAQNGSFFADIAGFDKTYTSDPDGPDGPQKAPAPSAKELSGLKVIDEQTFEVTLSAPTAVFPTKLGYSAFMPLPDAFFTMKPEEFGKKPIGNGPVKFLSWEDNVLIKLTRFDDYSLRDKMKIKDVDVKLYQDETAAYNDVLANNLDFLETLPTSALAGDKWKTDLGDRGLNTTTPSTALIAFPMYDKRFQNPKLRRAVSLAINRQEISDKIFFGTRKPADSWANPLTPGAKPGNCTACKFDPTTAKQLLTEAGGFSGEMVFYYNSDSSHKEWMDAVAQQVKTNLAINARAEGVPTFAVFRQNVNGHKMTGPYRAAWQQDYPDVENWVNPLYVTGGSSNDGLYSNTEVDALAKQAGAAPTLEASHEGFAKAIEKVDQDVPSIPIYFYGQQSGHSEKIKKLELNNVGELDITSVEL